MPPDSVAHVNAVTVVNDEPKSYGSESWAVSMHAVYAHMRCSDNRGTDVRLNPLQFFRPRAWPRQSINTYQWEWRIVQSYEFKKPAHINCLEVRAVLNYLRYRSRNSARYNSRFLLIVDSQVTASVMAKGRSSSQQLNVLLRRVSGLMLLCGFRLVVGWTHTEWNPADKPSRKLCRIHHA